LQLPEDVQIAIRDGKLGPAAAIEYARNPEEGVKVARKQLKAAEVLGKAVPVADAREGMREAKAAKGSGSGGVRTLKEVKLMLEEQQQKGLFGDPPNAIHSLINGVLNFADGFISLNKFRSVVDSGEPHARFLPLKKEKPVKVKKVKRTAKKGAKGKKSARKRAAKAEE
jgi:hypothetical protein